MRWERLLADLAALEEARRRADMLGEAAERSRAETGRVTLAARLRASEGLRLTFEVDGPHRCAGTVAGTGPGWVVLQDGAVQWLLVTRFVLWVDELPRYAAPEAEGAAKRIYDSLGLRHVLRGIAADRSEVRVGLGPTAPVTGTIDRVGGDFIDLALHPPGEPRRHREVTAHRVVAIDAIRYLQRSAA